MPTCPAGYGFLLPRFFCDVCNWATAGRPASTRARRMTGLAPLWGGALQRPDTLRRWWPAELNYDCYPIEVSPFLWTQVSGVTLGWAIPAPELALEDWPVVRFCPAGSGAVRYLAATTRAAFEMLLGDAVAEPALDRASREAATALAA